MKRVISALIITQLSVAFMLFMIHALTVRLPQADSSSTADFSRMKPTEPDYTRVESIVSEQISQLPVPKDGSNGKDAVVDYDKLKTLVPPAKNGERGGNATVDYEKIRLFVQEEVSKPRLLSVPQEVEQRMSNGSIEWRCTGDDLWTPLESSPILTESCI